MTTRVEGDKDQTLLRDKGGRGFPYLVFMDKEGEVVAKPRQRTVASFAGTLHALQSYDDLAKKAAGGDGQAKIDLFIADLELGKIGHMEATGKLDELPERTSAQAEKIDGFLIDWELEKLFRNRDRSKVGEKIAEMYDAGRVPAGGSYELSFWRLLLDHADKTGNAAMMEKALGHVKRLQFQRYDKRLAELKKKQSG